MQIIKFIVFAMLGIGATISFLNKRARNELINIGTTQKRIELRKIIYKKRLRVITQVGFYPIISLFSFWVLLIIYEVSTEEANVEIGPLIGMFVILLVVLIIVTVPLGIWTFYLYKGNLSYVEKQNFLQENSTFVLYLRGFENDDYSDRFLLAKGKNKKFSEYKFTKILSRYSLCAAIGMTKELDAPLGAMRIYVDDSTWKEDVKDLMEKSKKIYILINNRPNCIWEIETASKYLNKVVFIVDDPVKYVLTQEAVKESIKFPHIHDMTMNNRFFFLQCIGGNFTYQTFNNSKKGYKDIVGLTFEDSKKHI